MKIIDHDITKEMDKLGNSIAAKLHVFINLRYSTTIVPNHGLSQKNDVCVAVSNCSYM